MRERPSVGRVFPLARMQIQVIPAEVMEFMGEEGRQMIDESFVGETPSVPVGFHPGIVFLSVHAKTDKFVLLG